MKAKTILKSEQMEKEYKRKKDEALAAWTERLSGLYEENGMDAKTFRDVLSEMSKQSYIQGAQDTHRVYDGVVMRRGML